MSTFPGDELLKNIKDLKFETPARKTLISVPTVTWRESMDALELITDLRDWLKGDQEVVPPKLKNILRKDKKGSIDVTMWCTLCSENHTLHLNINKKDEDKRQMCQHTTFQHSRIK